MEKAAARVCWGGGWVGGWEGWAEGTVAICDVLYVGGWVGGWVVYLAEKVSRRDGFEEMKNLFCFLTWWVGGWVGG